MGCGTPQRLADRGRRANGGDMTGAVDQTNIFLQASEAFQSAAYSFVSGFPVFALHAGVTIVMLVLGVTIYVLLTPHKDIQLMRQGNIAAAISVGAVVLGLSIPLAVAMGTSVNAADIVIWGAATIVVQLLMFRLADLALPNISKRIAKRDVAAAVFLASVKLASAIILAAAANGAPLTWS